MGLISHGLTQHDKATCQLDFFEILMVPKVDIKFWANSFSLIQRTMDDLSRPYQGKTKKKDEK